MHSYAVYSFGVLITTIEAESAQSATARVSAEFGIHADDLASTRATMVRIYATTYCNHGHYVKTGKPVNHECITIPPDALKAEMNGDYAKAIEIMKARGATVSKARL